MTFEEVHEKLYKFIHYLSWKNDNGAPLMDHDEIVGELNVELVKGYQAYKDSHPDDELIIVLKRMMDYRISELIHMYYGTHRKKAVNTISITTYVNGDEQEHNASVQLLDKGSWLFTTADETDIVDPIVLIESADRVRQVYENVGDTAKCILYAVLYGNSLLAENMQLAGIRASYVFKKGGSITVRPYHLVNSLALDEEAVKISIEEIKRVYAEVLEND